MNQTGESVFVTFMKQHVINFVNNNVLIILTLNFELFRINTN